MRASVRGLLVIYAVAIAAIAMLACLTLGLLASLRGVTPAAVVAIAVASGLIVLAAIIVLLFRGIARPVDRLLRAAARLGPTHASGSLELPILGEPGDAGGPALERAAVAFERLAEALHDERARLAAKVDELTRSNRALAEARESLLRTEKLATVGRLAAGVAHEVGNPLGAVKGYADLARARLPADPHPELVQALARIDASAERIDRTIRDLLDFARPAPPLLAPIDLARSVDAALRLARVQTRFKHVEVEVDLPGDLEPVQADEHHLAQVLLNLLLNAGDAMQGAGRVQITGRRDGDMILLAVQDSGPGIAPADLPRIFDPFFTTKDPGQGTGLGLAISHRIMDGFGGSIMARSDPGGGAAFTLAFRAAGPRLR